MLEEGSSPRALILSGKIFKGKVEFPAGEMLFPVVRYALVYIIPAADLSRLAFGTKQLLYLTRPLGDWVKL